MLLSRSAAALLVVGVLGGMFWSWQALAARGEERAAAQAESIGRVVVAATAPAHLAGAAASSGALSPAEQADFRQEVHGLRRSGQLSALGLWRVDGTLLFQDRPEESSPLALSPAALARARSGKHWVTRVAGSYRVFLPPAALPASRTALPTISEVVVPVAAAGEGISLQGTRQQIILVATVAALIGGLLWLRRGLLRRERHARTDPLTGLLNRRALHEDAHGLLAGASSDRPAALLLIDLGEFKSVNDTLGHPAGDVLLQHVGAALKQRVRGTDLVVRLGGDEFAVLLTDLPDPSAAQLRAEELLADLRARTFDVNGITLTVDASVGVALAPQHGRRIHRLLQRADIAMYQAKGGHRGTMLYDPTTDGHSVEQLELVGELRRALDEGEFVLHYQPKISLPDRVVYGVEALARWQHPTRGLLPPGEFLPLLETTGLIQPFSQWVLREAVQQAATWRRVGLPLKVAVNLSTRSLLSPALPARVLATLAGAGLPPSFLELEITETAIMTNPERAAFILTQLRVRGIDVSIDDFGAGYTSLAFLRILPVSALKIDRSLVTEMLGCAEDRAVTEAVIDLGHRLGLRVIAEGVESEELLSQLAQLGCDRAQGYVISRPQPPALLEAWLVARRIATADPLGAGDSAPAGLVAQA